MQQLFLNTPSLMKKIFAACFMLLLFCTASAQSLAPPAIAARSWLLLDVSSNQVLASYEPEARIEPASLTKIMTAYLVFAALKQNKLDLNQMVKVSSNAWKVSGDGSRMFIDPAMNVSIHDLLYGLIVQSGNDAAVALGEAVASKESDFVELMNREAQRMGLKATHFSNSHGQSSTDHYSTASDLSILAARLITDFPELYKIYSVKSFTYNKITQPNRNRLLWLDTTVDGMKTGHTSAAGFCLIASARRLSGTNERRLISVVLGAESDLARAQESQKLLNWGFLNFDLIKIYAKDQAIITPSVWKGSQRDIRLGFDHDVYVSVPRGMAKRLRPVVERPDPLVAPIAQYSHVGTLKIMFDGKVINTMPLQALDPVKPATIFGLMFDSLRLFFQ